ncbi:MAG: phosphate ABC transporter permease subunit PstC [Oligoflexia bacterium]|nr:phosphate ABC transporter permease subunit PstC [Oligoflexia bacterium]
MKNELSIRTRASRIRASMPVLAPVTTLSLKERLLTRRPRYSFGIIHVGALLLIVVIIAMITLLLINAFPSIQRFGGGFIINRSWNPVEDSYSALPFIYGTLLTSFLALLIAMPLGIASAIFVNEYCPYKFRNILSILIDLIAAIPSIVFGMWGVFFLRNIVGLGILNAVLILTIMIIPTISSLSREIFSAIPVTYKEAALALGATNYEKIKLAILRPSISGIIGIAALALGRATGETMAVVMVIGNTPIIAWSLFAPAATLSSVLANEYAEASSDLHLSALCHIAVILFVISILVNSGTRALIRRYRFV